MNNTQCMIDELLTPINQFLQCETPDAWIDEARHYQDYLTLAEQIAGGDISDRIQAIGAKEAELIAMADDTFRFHSGVPA